MKGKILLFFCFATIKLFAQNDTTRAKSDTIVDISKEVTNKKKWSDNKQSTEVFYGQRLINTKTVEVLHKGVMAFTVIHTFGDIAGKKGGTKNFFGIDEVSDAQIGFQIGIGKHLNLALQHTVGYADRYGLQHFYEVGLKYQFMNQGVNGNPFSLTAYGNIVSTAQKLSSIDSLENSFQSSSDRLSELLQLMIGRKFGTISLQLSGTFLHTNLVVPGDQDNLLSVGGAIRFPLSQKIFIISDYFHSFRSQESADAWKNRGLTSRDVFGIGVEILTAGHVFHVNFTNARNVLENRFLPRTTDTWGKGQFRWGFTLTRNFTVFRDKKSK
ncbi:MAG: DUF5777 family beta-barrel protein [Chitinophagales bacterium]